MVTSGNSANSESLVQEAIIGWVTCLRRICFLTLNQMYDVLCPSGPLAVVRVARLCMTRDEMESEV